MSDYKTISILITALGGEGGGTLMNWIIECARSQKLFVQGTSVPGVAQRTGSTSYYIEICDRNFDNDSHLSVFKDDYEHTSAGGTRKNLKNYPSKNE